jgi:hypothetical protein
MLMALPEEAIVSDSENEHYIYYTLNDPLASRQVHFYKVRVIPQLIEDGFASMDLIDPLPEEALIVVKGGYYIRSMYVRSLE